MHFFEVAIRFVPIGSWYTFLVHYNDGRDLSFWSWFKPNLEIISFWKLCHPFLSQNILFFVMLKVIYWIGCIIYPNCNTNLVHFFINKEKLWVASCTKIFKFSFGRILNVLYKQLFFFKLPCWRNFSGQLNHYCSVCI